MTNQLKLRDLNFPVVGATISATLHDPHWAAKYDPNGDHRLFWSLDIQTAPLKVEGEAWEPRIYYETLHFEMGRWEDLEGRTLRWSNSFNEENGEPHGGFYVFEHGDIPKAELCIGRRSSERFEVRWQGVCNVNWDQDRYGENVPFGLEAVAIFTQVVVQASEKDDDASVRARLARHLDLESLIQRPLELQPHRYQDGVRIARSVFEPKL